MSIETEADADATDRSRVEELAEELGEAITETPEYQRFEETKEAVEADDEAQEKIREFEQIRQEFMLARQTGEADEEDMEKIREAQQDLHSLPVMDDYLDAQEALEAKLESLNDLVSDPLAVDFCDQASGCCED